MSHPSRVCGLKLLSWLCLRFESGSHPSRVCGLKQEVQHPHTDIQASHPSRVCGLKHLLPQSLRHYLLVTPLAGVWIETFNRFRQPTFYKSHPSRVCGLKLVCPELCRRTDVTPLAGVWIETSTTQTGGTWQSHTPRGCVD